MLARAKESSGGNESNPNVLQYPTSAIKTEPRNGKCSKMTFPDYLKEVNRRSEHSKKNGTCKIEDAPTAEEIKKRTMSTFESIINYFTKNSFEIYGFPFSLVHVILVLVTVALILCAMFFPVREYFTDCFGMYWYRFRNFRRRLGRKIYRYFGNKK